MLARRRSRLHGPPAALQQGCQWWRPLVVDRGVLDATRMMMISLGADIHELRMHRYGVGGAKLARRPQLGRIACMARRAALAGVVASSCCGGGRDVLDSCWWQGLPTWSILIYWASMNSTAIHASWARAISTSAWLARQPRLGPQPWSSGPLVFVWHHIEPRQIRIS